MDGDRTKTCGLIVAILALAVAIIGLLFGENLIDRYKKEPPFKNLYSTPTNTTGPIQKEQLGIVWKASITVPSQFELSSFSSQDLNNFEMEVDVHFLDNAPEFHGLMLRKMDDKSFYSFRVSPDGNYSFDKWSQCDTCEGASHEPLLGPATSNYIKIGSGKVNHLKVVANGSTFDLYINGNFVGSVEDGSYPQGGVGFIGCTCEGSSESNVMMENASLKGVP
jgi:hypothetical protein